MWFTTKVRYEKTRENGSLKTVTEPYLVDALSFTEAEARITNEMMPYTCLLYTSPSPRDS